MSEKSASVYYSEAADISTDESALDLEEPLALHPSGNAELISGCAMAENTPSVLEPTGVAPTSGAIAFEDPHNKVVPPTGGGPTHRE